MRASSASIDHQDFIRFISFRSVSARCPDQVDLRVGAKSGPEFFETSRIWFQRGDLIIGTWEITEEFLDRIAAVGTAVDIGRDLVRMMRKKLSEDIFLWRDRRKKRDRITGELIVDHLIENFSGGIIREQILGLIELARVRLEKSAVEQFFTGNGYVWDDYRETGSKILDPFDQDRQMRTETDDKSERLWNLLDLRQRQDRKTVKHLSAVEIIADENADGP